MIDQSPAPRLLAQGLSRAGDLLAEADGSGRLAVRRAASGRTEADLRLAGAGAAVIEFSPDGGLLAVGDLQGGIHLGGPGAGEPRTLPGHRRQVESLAWSADGGLLFSGGGDRTVRVWDARTGQPLRTVDVGNPADTHDESVRALAAGPDGRVFAAGTSPGAVRLWDADSGAPLRTLQDSGPWAKSLAFDPTGSFLVAGSRNGARLWQLDRDGSVPLAGPREVVFSVAVSPDGRTVAGGGMDRKVWLWDARTGALLHTLTDLNGWVAKVAFTPDGGSLVGFDGDGVAARWDSSSGELLAVSRRAPQEPVRPERAWERIAASRDWARIHCSCARGARHVPADFARLVAARTPEQAKGGGLLNDVVRGGLLSEAAVPLAELSMAALAEEELSPETLDTLLLLIGELVDGESDSTESAAGRPDLGEECCEVVAGGIPLLYDLLATRREASVLEYAQDILVSLGEDEEEVAAAVGADRRS
ncbi:hypothetical protein GCM10009759_34990 [Kitasatospora saccharophila]|uniref:WD40 repeat protein n=1 Tax=Kitasatospora saccharophila TaxID=407973 RepID=A0ABP5IIV1_9ACTN